MMKVEGWVMVIEEEGMLESGFIPEEGDSRVAG
jgi:hypothetical protein